MSVNSLVPQTAINLSNPVIDSTVFIIGMLFTVLLGNGLFVKKSLIISSFILPDRPDHDGSGWLRMCVT